MNVIVGSLPDYLECDEVVQIGWSYDGAAFLAPVTAAEPPVFPNLEPDQFWFVVRTSGYEPELLAWGAAMQVDDPIGWAAASAKLDFAKFFERDHAFVEEARQAMGMTVEELNALWAFGAGQ